MIIATKAPKATYPQLQIVPYAYALGLAVFAGAQLLSGSTSPYWLLTLVNVEIFALPFLLRCKLSWLARAVSAVFGLLAPYVILVNLVVVRGFGTVTLSDAMLYSCLVVISIASFSILNGQAALRAPKR
jgi:hypothetical protein